jgi:SAM-dependent methyltransferase
VTSVPASDPLEDYRSVWERKPVLRVVYDDFYDRIAAACRQGVTIEIGGGIGNLKRRLTQVVATDIQSAPWLDCVADAQRLPFADACAANVVMVDVLHHLEFPLVFFREAARVLLPGGRILMVEPAITWGATLFYRLLHHEPVCTSADVLIDGSPDPRRDPTRPTGNSDPSRHPRQDRFHRLFPALRIERVEWFALAAYPLTGGFKPWSLIGEAGPPHAPHRARDRAHARPSRGISHAAGRRERRRRRVAGASAACTGEGLDSHFNDCCGLVPEPRKPNRRSRVLPAPEGPRECTHHEGHGRGVSYGSGRHAPGAG